VKIDGKPDTAAVDRLAGPLLIREKNECAGLARKRKSLGALRAIAFSELVHSEASLLSRRDHQGALTFE
jgi:hypothetical protein